MPISDFTGTFKNQPWRDIQGAALLELAPLQAVNPTYQDISGVSWTSIGNTSDVSFNPNASVEPAYCAQMRHPYAIDVGRRAEQVTTEIRNLDVWNFALALSYDSDVVYGSSYFYFDPIKDAGETGQSSPYRHLRLTTEGVAGGADGGTPSAEQVTILYKVRPVGEEVTYGPDVKSSIPITFHAVGNSNDRTGILYNATTVPNPNY